MSWCNTASVVFYMGVLSAFEAARARASTVVQPVLQPRMVLHTTSDSAEALNCREWWEWISQLRNCLLTFISPLLSPLPEANHSFSIPLIAWVQRHMDTLCLIQTHISMSEWVRGSERLSGRLSVVCSFTQHTHGSYVGRFPDLYGVMSLRVFGITPTIPPASYFH